MFHIDTQTVGSVAEPALVRAGSGWGSLTTWVVALVVLALLVALGWWSTTRRRQR